MAQQEVMIQVGLPTMRLKEYLKLPYLLVLGKDTVLLWMKVSRQPADRIWLQEETKNKVTGVSKMLQELESWSISLDQTWAQW